MPKKISRRTYSNPNPDLLDRQQLAFLFGYRTPDSADAIVKRHADTFPKPLGYQERKGAHKRWLKSAVVAWMEKYWYSGQPERLE